MKQEQILGIVRHVLTFAGGILVVKGVASEGFINEAIGAVLSVIALIWSYKSKS